MKIKRFFLQVYKTARVAKTVEHIRTQPRVAALLFKKYELPAFPPDLIHSSLPFGITWHLWDDQPIWRHEVSCLV
jgi:hypothetical protein